MLLILKVVSILLGLLSSASAQTSDDKNCGNKPIFRCEDYWSRAAKDVEKMDFAELQGLKTVISACESDVAEDKILLHYCDLALENYYIEYSAKKRPIDRLVEAFIGEIQKLQSNIFFDEKISPNQSNQMRTEKTLARMATQGYMSSINRTLAEAVSARFQELRSSR